MSVYRNKFFAFVGCLLFLFVCCSCKTKAQEHNRLRVMFYNTENLFDIYDDPATNDNDFTPEGKMHWTKARYEKKLVSIYKVIAALGEWEPPEIVGFAEIENKKVLTDIFRQTPLSSFHFDFVHYESPDPRGIDVGLAYRTDKMKLLSQKSIPIRLHGSDDFKTRDIVYASFLVGGKDTLHIFLNHWPSRKRGELQTEGLRKSVAGILRSKADSLFQRNKNSKMLIMGDFNDEPDNESLTTILLAEPVSQPLADARLYNLSIRLSQTSSIGTHKFRGNWEVLDQFIVSSGLLGATKGLTTREQNAHIFSAGFMMSEDKRNHSQRPFPTYSGPKYLGGFSDHLPVYLDIFMKN